VGHPSGAGGRDERLFPHPPGDLPQGWRNVEAKEANAVWGKGVTTGNNGDQYTCSDEQTASCNGSGCNGMAVCSVHLMLANLQIRDAPVGYTPRSARRVLHGSLQSAGLPSAGQPNYQAARSEVDARLERAPRT